MFIEILKEIDPDNHQYNKLRYYLDRHIELDGDLHGPIAEKMVEKICAQSTEKWYDALYIAKKCLQYRISLWDSIVEKIRTKNMKLN